VRLAYRALIARAPLSSAVFIASAPSLSSHNSLGPYALVRLLQLPKPRSRLDLFA
jgi:hypothetical protein